MNNEARIKFYKGQASDAYRQFNDAVDTINAIRTGLKTALMFLSEEPQNVEAAKNLIATANKLTDDFLVHGGTS